MAVDGQVLRGQLGAADSLTECAQVVCRQLVDVGYALTSVYLCRSGRLRCYASSGYWQVLDGLPPTAGVIAATCRTGEPHLVHVADSDIYLPAAPRVVSEACVPVVIDDRVVGAINIESQFELPNHVMDVLGHVADLFVVRIVELGGVPEPDGWAYLADQAARLIMINDQHELVETALDIGMRLAAADSGILAIGDPGRGFRTMATTGVLAPGLWELTSDTLEAMGRWVDGPRSCYTVGEPDGEGFTAFDQLRTLGVGTLLVIGLEHGDRQLGFFAVTDRHSELPGTDLVEQLELLGNLVSSTLVNIDHVEALLHLASCDPLTGLGHRIAFGEHLAAVRNTERSCAVFSIDVDYFKEINDTHGHERGNQALRDLANAMSRAIRSIDCLFRTGGDEFAAVLTVKSEDEAMRIAHRLEVAARDVGMSVSIGVAFGLAHEDVDLYQQADEALYDAKRAGRGVAMLSGERRPG